MNSDWEEKRCHKRFPKTLSVQWQSASAGGSDPWKVAFLKDISRGGLAMQTGELAGAGERLRFRITLDVSTPPFICIGEVVRVQKMTSPVGYEVGVLFIYIGLRDADFIELLAHHYEKNKDKDE